MVFGIVVAGIVGGTIGRTLVGGNDDFDLKYPPNLTEYQLGLPELYGKKITIDREVLTETEAGFFFDKTNRVSARYWVTYDNTRYCFSGLVNGKVPRRVQQDIQDYITATHINSILNSQQTYIPGKIKVTTTYDDGTGEIHLLIDTNGYGVIDFLRGPSEDGHLLQEFNNYCETVNGITRILPQAIHKLLQNPKFHR
jgi:hypothetical protein